MVMQLHTNIAGLVPPSNNLELVGKHFFSATRQPDAQVWGQMFGQLHGRLEQALKTPSSHHGAQILVCFNIHPGITRLLQCMSNIYDQLHTWTPQSHAADVVIYQL